MMVFLHCAKYIFSNFFVLFNLVALFCCLPQVFALCRVAMFPFMYWTYLQQATAGLPLLSALAR